MADEMVRLSLLKDSMQWGCFWSIEDPHISFSAYLEPLDLEFPPKVVPAQTTSLATPGNMLKM